MKSLTGIVSLVRSIIPACPQPSIEQYLRYAAQRLCRESMVWTDTVSLADAVSDNFPYTIPAVTGQRVVKTLLVQVGDSIPLEPSTIDREYQVSPTWRTDTGVPERFVELPPGVVHITPRPATACDISLTVAYEPDATGLSLPDHVYDRYWEAIGSGAVAALSLIPTMPWLNPDLAALHSNFFLAMIDEAKSELHLHYRPVRNYTSLSPI